MAFRFIRLIQHSVCLAALGATLASGPGVAHAAQITGADALDAATVQQRALRVLREMQRDSVKVDGRHWQAAQRCDRAAMEAYLRQLNQLAAQARNVIRNAGLENDTSGNAITAYQIAENIEMRARHAASRQPKNCGETGAQEGTGGIGTTGGAQPQGYSQQMVELQQESVRLNSLHYQAAQRCDRAEMERIQAELDRLVDEAGRIMRETARALGANSPEFRDVERRAHNIADRAGEARKRQPRNCPEETEHQGTGGAGTGMVPGQGPQTPRFNSGSPLDGLRNRAWSAMEEMTDAYEKCDPERFERALNELEQLRREAKAAADAARGSAEFSTIKPEEAQNLADELQRQIEQRRYVLDGLKRECSKQHRPGGVGTILGPRRPESTGGQDTPNRPTEESPPNEPQSRMPDLLNVFGGGTRERTPENTGEQNDNPGASDRQQQSGGNTQQANEPQRETRTRPARDTRRDRCDKPEGERPADCPNR